MTPIRIAALVPALLLVTACGAGGGAGGQDIVGSPDPDPAVSSPSPDVSATSATPRGFLRIRGDNNLAYDAVLLDTLDVEVKVDGGAVPLVVYGGYDLANVDHAWRIASFDLPAPGSVVEVTLALDGAAAWEAGGASGALEVCGAPITFRAPAEWLALRGHAVVHVDLARSIVDGPAGKTFLPQIQVRY